MFLFISTEMADIFGCSILWEDIRVYPEVSAMSPVGKVFSNRIAYSERLAAPPGIQALGKPGTQDQAGLTSTFHSCTVYTSLVPAARPNSIQTEEDS